ncbi:Interferon-related developmental regulator 1 [Holothuria leucospilota]|uniref:Interferon-related developmental regulator 1 n=1 Tax=Holothuria leucospilota TaxID=206669 RepID=A0A9Q1CMZ1_HOLLE|nr:Interferon-related developmental regulator 1 [Holothuria leucospilota]
MPRKKPKKTSPKRSPGGAVGGLTASEGNETDNTDLETASVTSSHLSELDSIEEAAANLGLNDDEDDTSEQNHLEDKIEELIDGTTQKSASGRKTCLEGLRAAFAKKFLPEFVEKRKATLTDCIERCIKRGKGEEQAAAVMLSILVFIQLGGSSDTEEVFNQIKPVLLTLLQDKSASSKARRSCAFALGVGSFIAPGDYETLKASMNTLEQIFSQSYFKGDGSSPTHSPEVHKLHCAALSAWTLLLSIMSARIVDQMIGSHLPKLPQLLESDDVNLRIVAGEAIALFYELAREEDEEFVGDDLDELMVKLKELATDSNKYRAKKDRRQQRSSFRDIMKTIENNEAPDEVIKFGQEYVELDSWVRRRQYSALREVLGSGTNIHLKENSLLREIFGLGAPLVITPGSSSGQTKFERHQNNLAAFKALTKVRSKQRDKRIAVF